MEQVVWISVGVISVLLLFGILGGLYQKNAYEEKVRAAEIGAQQIGEMCRKVCRMPSDTYLSLGVTLPSGGVVNVSKESICVSFEEEMACSACACDLSTYVLDLDVPEAYALYDTHEFECFFLNSDQIILVECLG